MNNELVEKVKMYFNVFFINHQFEKLYDIFAEGLLFSGPLFKFTSATDYVESLSSSPVYDAKYEILHIFDSENHVNVIYRFQKSAIDCLMSQLFEFKENRIIKIDLIFDSSIFLKQKK